MYKIVLIDDENIVRRGIRDLVQWQELGLEMVGDAEDGEKGLELIRNVSPDIVFLDINMPKMDGLTVSKIVRESYPHIKIVLITGYDEFSYVREALRLGVEDYILKPITKVEVEALLKKLISKLDEDKVDESEQLKMRQTIKESNALLKQYCIENILFDDLEENLIRRKCDRAQIPYDKVCYGLALFDYDMPIKGEEDNQELTYFAIKNVLNEMIEAEGKGIALELEGKNAVLYLGEEEDEDTYHRYLAALKQTITQVLDITLTIGVGNLVKSLGEMTISYKQAREALLNRFFLGTNLIITKQAYTRFLSTSSKNQWLEWEKRLVEAINEQESFEKVLEEIVAYMEKSGLKQEECQNIWNILVGAILKRFIQLDETIIQLFPNTLDIMGEIQNKKTIQVISMWVMAIYTKCQSYIEEQVTPNRLYIKSIIRFIEEKYHVPELSITMVCQEVHLSPSYFSAIFKKETGCTFIQYITQYRLQKAKELLQYSNLKTYEVAEKVGYIDPQYFSTLFKKQFKLTPSQYKKLKGGEDDAKDA